jgi:outer membrane protein assembly factor BamD
MNKIKLLTLLVVCSLGASACSGMSSVEDEISHGTAKSVYVHGDMALAKGQFAEAVQYFEALDDRFPFSRYMAQAYANLVYAYYSLEQYDNALAVADGFVNVYARSNHADYVYYMRGLIRFERDNTWLKERFKREPALHDLANLRAAYDDFATIATLFPKSQYKDDATRRMVYIRNQLAESELLAAKYYFVKHAYMAAANRLNYLLAHFPEAPQQQQALRMLKDSYAHLGLKAQKQKIANLLSSAHA